jgi:hypothetical protein
MNQKFEGNLFGEQDFSFEKGAHARQCKIVGDRIPR